MLLRGIVKEHKMKQKIKEVAKKDEEAKNYLKRQGIVLARN